MDARIRLPLFLVVLAALSSCGGESASDVATNLQGVWKGTCQNCGGGTLTGVITADGSGAFYDPTGLVYFAKGFDKSILAGTGTTYATYLGVLDGANDTLAPLTLSGTASQTDIAGAFDFSIAGSNPTGPADNITADFVLTPDAAASRDAAVTAGTWSGYYVSQSGPLAVNLNVLSDDSISGVDANACNVSGSLTPSKGAAGVFSVQFSTTGKDYRCGKGFSGVAFASGHDDFDYFGGASGRYYYFILEDGTVDGGSFGAVIELQAP